jgi:hypothetical protein
VKENIKDARDVAYDPVAGTFKEFLEKYIKKDLKEFRKKGTGVNFISSRVLGIYKEGLSAFLRTTRGLGIPYRRDYITKKEERKILELGVPEELLVFYKKRNPCDEMELGEIRLNSVEEIIEENTNYVPGYVICPLGYVVIATNIYGDAFCLNLNNVDDYGQPEVVFVDHDLVDENIKDPEDVAYDHVTSTFKEFLEKYIKKDLKEFAEK